uniref:Uncharacterized protein n=1 Tax=Timema cristinae TaxID=61476 RepID=A0A7R9H143_TIMCR|nr:unnamed protein product [Timema cristinae]
MLAGSRPLTQRRIPLHLPVIRLLRTLLTIPRRSRGESAPEFSRHTLVKPRMYHGREKREISTTQEQPGRQPEVACVALASIVPGTIPATPSVEVARDPSSLPRLTTLRIELHTGR